MVDKTNEKEPTEESKEVYINVRLKGKTAYMFRAIQEKYNLKYNMETLRLITKKIFDQEFNGMTSS